MKGGYLCSATNPEDIYNIGNQIGKGGEGSVYTDREFPNIAIKVFNHIPVNNNKIDEKLTETETIFLISKILGDLDIGPKVYYYEICKSQVSELIDGTAKGKRRYGNLSAYLHMFSTPDYNRLKNIKGTDSFIFEYEVFVPYLVMEKVEGRTLSLSDIEELSIMGQVYDLYSRMYENNILHSDLHVENMIITPERIYIIDFATAKQVDPEKMPPKLTFENFLESVKTRSEELL